MGKNQDPGSGSATLPRTLQLGYRTCIVGRHGTQVVMKLVSPVVGWLEAVLLEKLVEKGEQHRIIVGEYEQVHRQQIRARLYILKVHF